MVGWRGRVAGRCCGHPAEKKAECAVSGTASKRNGRLLLHRCARWKRTASRREGGRSEERGGINPWHKQNCPLRQRWERGGPSQAAARSPPDPGSPDARGSRCESLHLLVAAHASRSAAAPTPDLDNTDGQRFRGQVATRHILGEACRQAMRPHAPEPSKAAPTAAPLAGAVQGCGPWRGPCSRLPFPLVELWQCPFSPGGASVTVQKPAGKGRA